MPPYLEIPFPFFPTLEQYSKLRKVKMFCFDTFKAKCVKLTKHNALAQNILNTLTLNDLFQYYIFPRKIIRMLHLLPNR